MVSDRTRAVFINNASFPSGWVASGYELEEIASVCRERDLWLVYFASFEGVLYDGRSVIHPASLDGMRNRTVTVGSVSLEQRMIGWRVGWVIAPDGLAGQVATVHSYNGLVASGFAQVGAEAALTAADDGLAAANAGGNAVGTKCCGNSADSPLSHPPEDGRCCWTSPRRRTSIGGVESSARAEGSRDTDARLG